tara:strand:+ start:31667 stop:31852 length:186 start_codon:yes stop_codon:yes gene_type:complete
MRVSVGAKIEFRYFEFIRLKSKLAGGLIMAQPQPDTGELGQKIATNYLAVATVAAIALQIR